jgi:hypothetical protein
MARRSATNERYQKFTGPKGQTRKSASQAKPKRSSGTPSTSSNSKSKSGAKGAARIKLPESPAYKAARKLWWTLLGIGLVLTAVSWLVRDYVHTSWANGGSAIALGLAYTMIFYALYIDWTRLRPERKAMAGGPKPKPAEKPSKKAAADETAKASATDKPSDTDHS